MIFSQPGELEDSQDCPRVMLEFLGCPGVGIPPSSSGYFIISALNTRKTLWIGKSPTPFFQQIPQQHLPNPSAGRKRWNSREKKAKFQRENEEFQREKAKFQRGNEEFQKESPFSQETAAESGINLTKKGRFVLHSQTFPHFPASSEVKLVVFSQNPKNSHFPLGTLRSLRNPSQL